jgi:hypothetical protein
MTGWVLAAPRAVQYPDSQVMYVTMSHCKGTSGRQELSGGLGVAGLDLHLLLLILPR